MQHIASLIASLATNTTAFFVLYVVIVALFTALVLLVLWLSLR